jgi:glycerophosphoryl diester phosphodiesterase
MTPPPSAIERPREPDAAWSRPFLRIGHGGAGGLATANTLHSLDLALELGVDMVEFDVRPCLDDEVLLHDEHLAEFGAPQVQVSQCTLAELRRFKTGDGEPIPTLTEALDLLQGRALINVDLKAAGYEAAVVANVQAHGLADAVIYSSVIPASLRRVRALDPHARIGLSYPEDRGGASTKPYLKPMVDLVVLGMRLLLPYRILRMMAEAQADAVMLYHRVVSRRAVQVVQRAGGKVFTWTVDDPARMQTLKAMGVNGITSNHPEHFAAGLTHFSLTASVPGGSERA